MKKLRTRLYAFSEQNKKYILIKLRIFILSGYHFTVYTVNLDILKYDNVASSIQNLKSINKESC